jgi:hypothetical protein
MGGAPDDNIIGLRLDAGANGGALPAGLPRNTPRFALNLCSLPGPCALLEAYKASALGP